MKGKGNALITVTVPTFGNLAAGKNEVEKRDGNVWNGGDRRNEERDKRGGQTEVGNRLLPVHVRHWLHGRSNGM